MVLWRLCYFALTLQFSCFIATSSPDDITGQQQVTARVTIPTVTLNTGYKMPVLGLGTGRIADHTENATREALKLGYRLIDTAILYGATKTQSSEQVIGKVIRDLGILREELFIVTKIMPLHFSSERSRKGILKSMKYFQTSYIDLVLIHEPECDNYKGYCDATGTYIDGWKSLEALVDEGLVRSIGLSNCYKEEIAKIKEIAKHPISVIQNWFDPLNQDKALRIECQNMGIVYMGYCTLGVAWIDFGYDSNPVLTDEVINKIAREYERSPSDVVLKWAVQNNVVVIPGSKNPTHLEMNLNSLSLQLSDEDLHEIDQLDGKIEPEFEMEYDAQEESGGLLSTVISTAREFLGFEKTKADSENEEL